jgi:hypothetical protein
VQRWLARHPRFHLHFTPTSASWLNKVERFFRDLTQNRLRRGIFRDLEELIMAIGTYIDRHNESPKPFIWTAFHFFQDVGSAGLANGLRGDYLALIEKRNLAGLSYMKAGRVLAEKLVSLDPSYYDAYLAIGVENYLLGVTVAPVRWFLRSGGAETNKDQGIANLKLTASKGRYLAPYARLLLAVAALRDQDRTGARNLLGELSHEFPQNDLFQREFARIQP